MRERICKISLFSAILTCVATMPGVAAVKTKNSNRSYAAAYQQVNAWREQQEYATTTTNAAAATLPVMVDDEKLAQSIVNNENNAPSVSDLEACSMIYPGGNFRWGVPEYGMQQKPQCVAVVELRHANTNAVLASTTVAAGQSIKCNIDSFPESSYNLSALSQIKELPADRAPTMEDVIAVMNEEQKQNAGLKIAAGAIIAGAAGNLLAKKDATDNTNSKIPIGTGKTQLIDTAIGVAAGAGIMAASSFSGKVAGDTIKSTAVNAASGMLIGNMLAGANGGNSVIATTRCSVVEKDGTKIEHDCVIGNVSKLSDENFSENGHDFCIISDAKMVRCCTKNDGTYNYKCTHYPKSLVDIELKTKEDYNGEKIYFNKLNETFDKGVIVRYLLSEKSNDEFTLAPEDLNDGDKVFYQIKSANIVGETRRAYAVFAKGTLNKPLGYKLSDWEELNSTYKPKIYGRNYDGSIATGTEFTADKYRFIVSSRDSDDGALIDISNPARAKGTIVGTAAGGALGGFAGYQGAKDEVSERWLSATQEYEGSLSNFVCFTGNRLLAKYNDYADIPALKTDK